jgi:hypothetical protein
VAVRTREIYRSANGDRWLLARDPDTDRVFVAAGKGPEKQELLRLIGSLV